MAKDEAMQTLAADTGWQENLSSLASEIKFTKEPYTRYYWTVSVRTDEGEEEISAVNCNTLAGLLMLFTENKTCPILGHMVYLVTGKLQLGRTKKFKNRLSSEDGRFFNYCKMM